MFQTASDLGGTQFYIDFYILPISVSEAILGVQWLKSLGHIVTDYANLTMKFTWENETSMCMELLHGPLKRYPPVNWKDNTKDSISAFYYLAMSNVSSNSIPTFCSSPPIIRPVLQEFEVLFQEPKGLPLIRDNRHQIHLI